MVVVQESHRNSNSNHYQNMQISFIFVRMILLVLPLLLVILLVLPLWLVILLVLPLWLVILLVLPPWLVFYWYFLCGW